MVASMVILFAVITVWSLASAEGWQADPALVRDAVRTGWNADESKVRHYVLPSAMSTADGGIVQDRSQWPQQREHLLSLFRTHVYGQPLGHPEKLRFELIDPATTVMDGQALLKRVVVLSEHRNRQHRFELTLLLPTAARGPSPVLLLLNNRGEQHTDGTRSTRSNFWPAERVIARGYGIAAVQVGELAPDDPQRARSGIIQLFEDQAAPRPGDACGALGAWAWGASRAMDYFETDPQVNAKQITVLGHSRGGKAALWAGAQDERFALVISNNSGCCGAALSRRNFGETIAAITSKFGYWFCGNLARYRDREDDLPVDQHMLLTLIAPRPLYVASASDDLWADPRGEFLSLAHSSPVYRLWNELSIEASETPKVDQPIMRGRRGYHIRTGGHDLTPYDWDRFMDFADKLFQ